MQLEYDLSSITGIQQFCLAMQAAGTSVTDVDHSKFNFKKPKLGSLRGVPVLARKFLDAIYFLASREVGDSEGKKTFSFDFKAFAWLTGSADKSRAYILRTLRSLQNYAFHIETSNDEQATPSSVPVVALASSFNDELIFELPNEVLEKLVSQQNTVERNIVPSFKTLKADLLYDYLAEFVARGESPWVSLEQLATIFEKDNAAPTSKEYRYLKRDCVDVALKEINEHSGLEVKFLARRGLWSGKGVGFVKFQIAKNHAQEDLRALTAKLELVRREFGLSLQAIQNIQAEKSTYTLARLEDATLYTRHHLDTGSVRNPGGFFMNALKAHYVLSDHVKLKHIEQEKKSITQSPLERLQALQAERDREQAKIRSRRDANLASSFNKLPACSQEALLAKFYLSGLGLMVRQSLDKNGVSRADRFNHLQSVPWMKSAWADFLAVNIAEFEQDT